MSPLIYLKPVPCFVSRLEICSGGRKGMDDGSKPPEHDNPKVKFLWINHSEHTVHSVLNIQQHSVHCAWAHSLYEHFYVHRTERSVQYYMSQNHHAWRLNVCTDMYNVQYCNQNQKFLKY